jgi:hypothetical protein
MLTASILSPSPTAHAVEVDDDAIVIDERSGALYRLTPTGALLWRCLDGVSTLEEICEDIAEAFDAPLDSVAAVVTELMAHLLAVGVVEDRAASRAAIAEVGEPCGCGAHEAHVEHDPRLLVDPPSY